MGAGRKRRRGGDLARVAEMVLVLAAAGEVRGGQEPTPAERALAAEARGKLAAAVEEVARPRELVPKEAVCKLVEDLGLGRGRDPTAMGYRRRRAASIAERVILTKRKMEQVKGSFLHSTSNVPETTPSGAMIRAQQGASKSTGSPWNLSTPIITPVILKQPLSDETIAGASYVKPANIPSIDSLLPVGSVNIKVKKDVHGSQVERGDATIIDQANKSYHLTATGMDQNSIRCSSEAGKSLDKNKPAIQFEGGSVAIGHQTPSGELSVHKQLVVSHQKEIAARVKRILYQPSSHRSWTVPSTEYMNTRLDCQICKVSTINMESLIVCDACERGMHLRCLQRSGNQVLAKTEWYCPPCLAQSEGKLLPRKYGKVKRTFVALKTRMTGGATLHSSQVAAESPTKKDCSKKAEANEHATNQNFDNIGNILHNNSSLALNTTSSKSLSISGAGPQKENVRHDEASFMTKEINGQPCGGIHVETAKPGNEGHSSGASTYSSSNLSGESHIHAKSNSVNSVENSNLQSTAYAAFKHLNRSSIVSSKENCESEGTSYQQSSKKVQLPSSTTPTDEINQVDRVANNEIKKAHEQEVLAYDAISYQVKVRAVNLNGQICPDFEISGDLKDGFVGCSTSSIVDWVGDALEAVNNKTYYNSCVVDGITYNLHDHILIVSEGSKAGPCKLQSMWQEHDSGSRLAMVNPYLFPSDIPEFISKPCTDEENEVYGSNDQRVVLLTAICGPCEVLHLDRFREEAKRRCQLDGSRSRLHPIFFCRWNYDESTHSFYKDYSFDNQSSS